MAITNRKRASSFGKMGTTRVPRSMSWQTCSRLLVVRRRRQCSFGESNMVKPSGMLSSN